MSVPGIVQSRLDGEQVAAQVPLGGEDALFVTPTRTLIYRADGLLSDESVEEYSHEAERIEISEGRRKAAVELDYGYEGAEKFKIPSSRLYEALHPVLAGVLNAADVTGPEETVKQTYQFSELTLVVTSERVVKHVGAAVWDEDYEEYPFAGVTALDVEEGSVSSQIIVETDGRPQRIKTPSDQTREVRERIERALLEYHEAESYEEFARQHADAESQADAEGESDAEANEEDDEAADPLAGGVDPIDANPPELDDDGGIIDDEASVTTDQRDADDADATTADATATDATAASAQDADAGAETAADAGTETSADAGADTGADAGSQSSAGAGATADASVSPDVGAGADESSARSDADSETDDRENAASEADQTTSADLTEDASRATATTEAEVDAGTGTETDSGFADSGFEPASSDLEADSTDEQLQALTEAVERQNELLAEQQRTLEQLIEELSRGR